MPSTRLNSTAFCQHTYNRQKLPIAKQVLAVLHTWHPLKAILDVACTCIRELVALRSAWCTLVGTLYVLAPAREPLWDSFVQGTWRSYPTTEVKEGQGLLSRTAAKNVRKGEAGCSLFFPFPLSSFFKARRIS